MTAEHWMAEPETQDYPGAQSYLSLLVGKAEAAKLVKALRSQKTLRYYAADDMLRASGLPLLPADDPEVATDLKKVRAGTKLSPVLLVLGNPLWVADGYHRICISYYIGEKTEIPCRAVKRKS